MRKIISILLLITFFNSFLYYIYFSFSIIKVKFESSIAIRNSATEKDWLKIPVTALQKDESDEVWYLDKLYDVAKRGFVNGREFVYVVRDEEEQDMLAKNDDYFKNDTGIFLSNGNKLISQQKKWQSITDNNYVVTSLKNIFSTYYLLKPTAVKNIFCITSICPDVLTPPPKLS